MSPDQTPMPFDVVIFRPPTPVATIVALSAARWQKIFCWPCFAAALIHAAAAAIFATASR
jgi:hypothetical protein